MAKKRRTVKKEEQMKRKLLYCVVVFLLFVVACISGRYSLKQEQGLDPLSAALADTELQIHTIDVGQGDCTLIVCEGKTMLIDGSESSAAPAIQAYLQKLGVTHLDYVAATHMHADHIGGLPAVMAEMTISHVIEPVYADSLVPTTKTYERYLDAIEASGASYEALTAGDSFTLGGAAVTVLGPVGEEKDEMNNTSLVLKLVYDDVSCLFTGDMEADAEEEILLNGGDVSANYLKVGHHGSDTSSSALFLEKVRPDYATISCGVDNKYGHPCDSTMEALRQYTDDIRITAEVGDIVFAYDKETGSCGFVEQ